VKSDDDGGLSGGSGSAGLDGRRCGSHFDMDDAFEDVEALLAGRADLEEEAVLERDDFGIGGGTRHW
jgi:hypothetical protein